jgi:hypothetical protein
MPDGFFDQFGITDICYFMLKTSGQTKLLEERRIRFWG